MTAGSRFRPGDGVRVTDGPLAGIYGTIIMFDDRQQKYLVRFTGQQQLFYPEDVIVPWS